MSANTRIQIVCVCVCVCVHVYLIWMTFDIKVDGELEFDTLFHCFFKSGDPLSSKFIPEIKMTVHESLTAFSTCFFSTGQETVRQSVL